MYVELDHKLVPRKIQDINERNELPGRETKEIYSFQLNKYDINRKNMQAVLKECHKQNQLKNQKQQQREIKIKQMKKDGTWREYMYRYSSYMLDYFAKSLVTQTEANADQADEDEERPREKKMRTESNETDLAIEYEPVIGPSEDVFFDCDWGFFSAVAACYNNHWVLKTCPDDWWNVIVRNVARVIDEKGDLPNVRSFFVDHESKETIAVEVPSMAEVDYNWLFDQFATGIKKKIKSPGYADVMQADFSSTTPTQLISTQIMMMASMQKYFDYEMYAGCGIPGVDMAGTQEDWEKLVEKLDKVKALLQPIMTDLDLEKWFGTARKVVTNLLDAYCGKPDKKWWYHILCWNSTGGMSSGGMSWWNGWMTEFLMAENYTEPRDFPSGVVSVPLKINDMDGIEDTGILVAGTVGFTVEEGERAPLVMPKQGWSVLMPLGSPITPRLLGK